MANTVKPKPYGGPGSNFTAQSPDNTNLEVWEKNGNSYAFQCKLKVGAGSIPPTDVAVYAQGCEITLLDSGMQFVNLAQSGLAPVWSPKPVTVKVSLTSAQILALNTTPIQLIAAPATVGYVIDVLSVNGRMNFLTAAYATNTELDIIDTTTGDVLFKDTATLLAATSTKVVKVEPNIASNTGIAVTPGGSVSVKAAAGNPATGAGTLDLYVTYQVIPL